MQGTGIQLTLISSRVGRRVAVLLVLTGLLPLLVLSGVTRWMVSSYLRDQEQTRQRAIAKASAMAALDRLLDTEERLRALASLGPGARLRTGSLRGVLALAQLDRSGRAASIFGDLRLPQLDAAVGARLAAGQPVLLMPAAAGRPIHLIVPAEGMASSGTIGVAAALDLRVLWALDDQPGDGRLSREVCAAASNGLVLGCTDPRLPGILGRPGVGGSGVGTFTATLDGEELTASYWSAPIQAHFGVPLWTSVVVTRTAEAMAPASALVRTVVLVAAATICLVLLVSFRQIRRLLDPIGRLQAGTARLARGDFAARVDVRTGDELQSLGEAFNGMATDLQRQFEQLHALSVGTLEALARAIDAKSPWTAGHSTRVAEVAVAMARAMHFDAPSQERIYRGALLHDIGKIGISADILDKAGRLTAAEKAAMDEHPVIGARILEPVPPCADILAMVRQHHERFDGGGYPDGLAGDAISFDARLLSVADAYDAMTSNRPYRPGMQPRDAMVSIAAGAGTQFDPHAVEGFVDAFRLGRIATHPADARIEKSA